MLGGMQESRFDTTTVPGLRDRIGSARRARLWRRWRIQGDASARGKLIESLLPLVDAICRRRRRAGLPAFMDPDDMTSAAYESLIHSVDRYDPRRGSAIESVVWTRCQGAVLDWMREESPTSRGLVDYERRRDALAHALGRTPSDAEIAEALDLTGAQTRQRELESATRTPASLQDQGPAEVEAEELGDTLVSQDRRDDPEASLELADTTRVVRAAVRRLPERERLALVAPVLEGTPLREIGEELGVSESRVSQLRARAMEKLHDELEPHREVARAA
jgi:RNA polymerase sigma factor for flagellar operon FliA